MGVLDTMHEHPPLPFLRFTHRRVGRRQEGAAHADGPHLEDAVAERRQGADQTHEESMGPELRERDFLWAGPLTKEGGDLGEGLGRGGYLEKLEEATRRAFRVPADVKTDPRTPARAEVLHPVRDGSATDSKLHEGRFPARGSPGFSLREMGLPLTRSHVRLADSYRESPRLNVRPGAGARHRTNLPILDRWCGVGRARPMTGREERAGRFAPDPQGQSGRSIGHVVQQGRWTEQQAQHPQQLEHEQHAQAGWADIIHREA
jgi:hypothetical protein